MKKKCSKCRRPRLETDFPLRSKKTGIRQSYCRFCKKDMQNSWYERNKQTHCANIREDKKRRKEADAPVIRELKSKPCTDCREKFPYYVMDFDHRPGETKSFEIARSLYRYGLERILAEIQKCDLLCANCHRIRTHQRQFPNAEERLQPAGDAAEKYIGVSTNG